MKLGYVSDYKFNSVFIRTFVTLVIFSIILIFSSNYIVYEKSTAIQKEQTYLAHLSMLNKTSETVDQIFDQINLSSGQLLQNSGVINAMVVPDMHRYARNNEIIKDLNNIVSSNEYIRSVYIYVPFNNTVFCSSGGVYQLKDFYDKDWIIKYSENPDSFYQFDVRMVPNAAGEEFTGVTASRDFPDIFRARLGQVIINLDGDRIYKKIQSNNNNMSGEFFIMNSDGKVLLHQDKNRLGENLKNHTYTQKILKDSQGYFTDYVNGKKTLFFHTTSSDTGWKYIYHIPFEKLNINTMTVLNLIFFTTLICILLSLILSFLITNDIYRPVQKLMSQVLTSYSKGKLSNENSGSIKNEYEFLNYAYSNVIDRNSNMEAFLDSVKPVVKEKLFTSLLTGGKLDTQVITERFKFINIDFGLNNFVVIVIQIDNYAEFSNTHSEVQGSLYKISMVKQVEDIVTGMFKYKCVCVGLEMDKISVVINFNDSAPLVQVKQDTVSIANEIKTRIKENCPFTITLGIGRPYKNIDDITLSYKEANNALNYKMYLGKNNIIDIENIEKQPEELYYFHSEKEKLLINNLKVGNKQEVIAIIGQLFEEIEESGNLSNKYVQQIFTRIISLMIELVIESGVNVKDVFGEKHDLYHEFSQKETIQDIKSWLTQTCITVINSLEEINLRKQSKYIQKLKEYITENSNNDISLIDAAEYIGLNSAYLSKLFKENFGQNFIDYLNITRINKAKQLLINTHLSVKEIGFIVGFNTIQNFMRAFKKYEGVTPGQYRENM